jgi:hypothetical protein
VSSISSTYTPCVVDPDLGIRIRLSKPVPDVTYSRDAGELVSLLVGLVPLHLVQLLDVARVQHLVHLWAPGVVNLVRTRGGGGGRIHRCWGSVTFLYGSGYRSANPYL